MGANGLRLVEEKYTWDAVVKKMLAGYKRAAEYDTYNYLASASREVVV